VIGKFAGVHTIGGVRLPVLWRMTPDPAALGHEIVNPAADSAITRLGPGGATRGPIETWSYIATV